MKLIALHDQSGKILAAVRVSDYYEGPIPVAARGARVLKVDLPKAHAKLDLAALCTRLRVDKRTHELVEHKARAGRKRRVARRAPRGST